MVDSYCVVFKNRAHFVISSSVEAFQLALHLQTALPGISSMVLIISPTVYWIPFFSCLFNLISWFFFSLLFPVFTFFLIFLVLSLTFPQSTFISWGFSSHLSLFFFSHFQFYSFLPPSCLVSIICPSFLPSHFAWLR